MRNPPQDPGNVKRFSYKKSSSPEDGQSSYHQKGSNSSLDGASRSMLGGSDMDVIRRVRKDDRDTFRDKLLTVSPPLMTGFYSRYTSQDPRFKSLLDAHEKDSGFGQDRGQSRYSFSQKKASYSYLPEKGKQNRYSEPSSFGNNASQHGTTQRNLSHQEYSGKSFYGSQDGGGFDTPGPASEKERHSSNSWDDFF